MDHVPIGGFQALGSYGIAGAIAAGLLGLFVLIFRQLIQNMLDQNKRLQDHTQAMQQQQVQALSDIRESLRNLSADVTAEMRELNREFGVLFNQLTHGDARPSRSPTETTRRLQFDPTRRPPKT